MCTCRGALCSRQAGNMERRTIRQTIDLDTGHITEIGYYKGDKLHRDVSVGPALLSLDGETGEMRHREFRVHGKLHNPEGPASEFWTAGMPEQIGYSIDGRLHREGAPALVRYRVGTPDVSYEGWYQRGLRHRDPSEGPAERESNFDGSFREAYFVAGKRVRKPSRPLPFRPVRTTSKREPI